VECHTGPGSSCVSRDHSTTRLDAAEGGFRPKKSSVHILNFRKGNYVKMRQDVKKNERNCIEARKSTKSKRC